MRKFIYKTFLAVTVLFALALGLSYLAININPASFALPAFFGLAYPYLLLVNIFLALIWIVFRRFEALIPIVIITAGLNHLSNYIKLSRPAGEKTGTFKILSYNVRLFNYFESRKNSNSEKKIMELLKTQQPEIIFLQEVYFAGDPDHKEMALKSALNGKYYSHTKFISAGGNRYYGIVTLSKFPIIGRGDIVYPGSSSLSIYSDIVMQEDTFRIFNNHLQSFRLKRMERSFLNELTTASDEKETLSEIRNISTSLRRGFIRRASQAQSLKAKINSSPYSTIVAGDFNDTPVSYSYRKIRKGLNDSFVASGYGAGFTYKGNYPPNRIDYILYDNSLNCSQFDILKVRYSDHYPILAYFRKRN